MWAASKFEALDITWDKAPMRISSKDIWDDLRAASKKDGAMPDPATSPRALLPARSSADFELPFWPMHDIAAGHGSYKWIRARYGPARKSWRGCGRGGEAAGFRSKVIVNQHLIGGGFVQARADMVVAVVRIAKGVDGPVKVVWTREEDIQHDVYRPVYRDTIAATLSDGKIAAWKYRIAGAGIIARWLPAAFQKGVDIDAVDGAVDIPYDIPNIHVDYVRAEPPAFPTGFWRGGGTNNHVFAIECFMDELARKAGRIGQFRRPCWEESAAAGRVAAEIGASRCQPARRRGVCRNRRSPALLRPWWGRVDEQARCICDVTSAVDTGIAVNPDTIAAQLEGGLIFGLTAALWRIH
jgi:isoquinoline 1-oxidoreductase beta subunit